MPAIASMVRQQVTNIANRKKNAKSRYKKSARVLCPNPKQPAMPRNMKTAAVFTVCAEKNTSVGYGLMLSMGVFTNITCTESTAAPIIKAYARKEERFSV